MENLSKEREVIKKEAKGSNRTKITITETLKLAG